MRKHGGQPSRHDKQSRWRRSALSVLPGAALLGATSQVKRDVSRLPSSRAEPLAVRHRADARGNHGAPLHDRVYLPTYLCMRTRLQGVDVVCLRPAFFIFIIYYRNTVTCFTLGCNNRKF